MRIRLGGDERNPDKAKRKEIEDSVGRGVGMPHERRTSVLQGEGGDAVGGGHARRVTLPVRV